MRHAPWEIFKAVNVWYVYRLDGDFGERGAVYEYVAEFPSGAEAIAAFAAGGR